MSSSHTMRLTAAHWSPSRPGKYPSFDFKERSHVKQITPFERPFCIGPITQIFHSFSQSGSIILKMDL